MIQSYLNNYDVEFSEISSGTSLLSTHKEAGNCQLKSFLYQERNIYVQILPTIRTNEVTERIWFISDCALQSLFLIPANDPLPLEPASNSRKSEAFKGLNRYSDCNSRV